MNNNGTQTIGCNCGCFPLILGFLLCWFALHQGWISL